MVLCLFHLFVDKLLLKYLTVVSTIYVFYNQFYFLLANFVIYIIGNKMQLSIFLFKFVNNSVIGHDIIKLFVRAGSGGNGIMRFNGVGGAGGYVFARPTRKITFEKFAKDHQNSPELKSENGGHSKKTKLVGKSGKDLIIDVPMNVDIFNKDAILLAQCRNAKQLYLVASGGKGGCAMNGYKGEQGDRQWIVIKQCEEDKREKKENNTSE